MDGCKLGDVPNPSPMRTGFHTNCTTGQSRRGWNWIIYAAIDGAPIGNTWKRYLTWSTCAAVKARQLFSLKLGSVPVGMNSMRRIPTSSSKQADGNVESASAFAVTEKEFQAQVVELAGLLGWQCYHTFDSRHSAPGWPDLALWRPGRFMLVELKTESGRLTPVQAGTIMELKSAGVDVRVWRPSQFDEIVAVLAQRAGYPR